MFKIIQLDVSNNYLYTGSNSYNYQLYKWYDLKNEPILQSQNFERTLASIGSKASGLSSLMTSQSDMTKSFGSTNILDLEKRSSCTHKFKFILNLPCDVTQFFEQNNILYEKNNGNCCDSFSLLKYKTGDFFLNHRDTDLSNDIDNLIHQYTCLIFCPYGENNDILQGGELVLQQGHF